MGDGSIPLNAIASSELEVTVKSSTPGICTVDADGQNVRLVSAGICTLTATQDGNDVYEPATATKSITVKIETQRVRFNPQNTVGLDSLTLNLSASASSGLSVTFTSSPSAICVVSGGKLQLLKAGSCSVTATQEGDSTYAMAQTTAVIEITRGSQTIAFSMPSSISAGGASTVLSAISSRGLPVTYSSLTPDICEVSGQVLTGKVAGTCRVMASQAGSTDYAAASSTASTQITAAKPTVSLVTPQSALFGTGPGTVSASSNSPAPITISSNTPSVCSVSGGSVTYLSGGTCTIVATQVADGAWQSGSATASFTVAKAAQTVTFSGLSDVVYGSGAVSLVATASSGLPVTFTSSTTNTCTVSGSQVSIKAAGTCTINAAQAGNTSYNQISATKSFQITKATLTVTASSPNAQYNSAAPVITPIYSGFVNGDSAEAASFLTGLNPPSCSSAYTTASAVGSKPVSTCVGGSSANYTFTFIQGAVTVTKAEQTITFNSQPAKTYGDAPFVITANSTSKLPVQFTSATPSACTVIEVTVTIKAAATCLIYGNQAGDGNYNAAPQANLSISVSKAALTITAPSTSVNFGNQAPTLKPIYSGFVNGESATSTNFTSGLSEATCSSGYFVGARGSATFTSTCAGGASSNYQFTNYVSGLLTVKAIAPSTVAVISAQASTSSSAVVKFSIPASDGGAPITQYIATSSPEGRVGVAASFGDITVSGLTAGVAYTFTVVAVNVAGNSTASSPTNSVDTRYYIGATGPGGGIVFYDALSPQPWGRYLEAAPSNWYGSSDAWAEWSSNGLAPVRGTASAIGYGSSNTDSMIATDSTPGYAATLARAYGSHNGTVGQWFLPSRYELLEMLKFAQLLGLQQSTFYWSSRYATETSEIFNACYGPTPCRPNLYYWTAALDRWSDYRTRNAVRPIRAFS